MGYFEIHQPQSNGLLALDLDGSLAKSMRGGFLSVGATKYSERTPGRGNFQSKHLVEPGNVLFWKHKPGIPRGAWGSWSFALPARHLGKDVFQPLETHDTPDPDFEELPVFVLGGQKVPEGADAVVFATAGHGAHEKVALVAGVAGPLIAHWRGNTPPDYSTHVFDIRGNSKDPDRHAGLDTVFEVRKWVPPCSGNTTSSGTQEYTVALNGRASPEGQGFLHVSFGDTDGLFSFMANGPLVPSFYAKHGLAHTGDAWMSAGAISTNAYYRGSKMPFTAPLAFEEELYPPVLNGDIPYEVHRQYDGSISHPFLCGDKQGQWREFVKLPIGETPPCTPTKDYSAVDANSNPRRSYAEGSRTFVTKKIQSTGLYFQPRPQLVFGRVS